MPSACEPATAPGAASAVATSIDRISIGAAVHAAVLVHELGGQERTAVLVDASLALGARQRIDGADHQGTVGSGGPVATVGPVVHEAPRRPQHIRAAHVISEPVHRSTVASTLAAAWVAAGTVHVPVAHRCHDSRSPAPRSTGSTATP